MTNKKLWENCISSCQEGFVLVKAFTPATTIYDMDEIEIHMFMVKDIAHIVFNQDIEVLAIDIRILTNRKNGKDYTSISPTISFEDLIKIKGDKEG